MAKPGIFLMFLVLAKVEAFSNSEESILYDILHECTNGADRNFEENPLRMEKDKCLLNCLAHRLQLVTEDNKPNTEVIEDFFDSGEENDAARDCVAQVDASEECAYGAGVLKCLSDAMID